ncbi:hypothetical protein LCGC14_0455630 [marine sediment metagenome]|uniref:Uncharacterized protein n=1 Tax=marine sediment metagenome TaxID=412755 RepID=A0A0F9SZI4_9ZZZZ
MSTTHHPIDGTIVLHCGHLDAECWHAFRNESPVKFRRKDGTADASEWVCVCGDCFDLYEDKPMGCATIRGDGVWRDNAPTLVQPN